MITTAMIFKIPYPTCFVLIPIHLSHGSHFHKDTVPQTSHLYPSGSDHLPFKTGLTLLTPLVQTSSLECTLQFPHTSCSCMAFFPLLGLMVPTIKHKLPKSSFVIFKSQSYFYTVLSSLLSYDDKATFKILCSFVTFS